MKTILKPKTEWGSWKQEAEVAQKRTTVKRTGAYDPTRDMLAPAARVGASDHEQYPSLRGNTLHYRDGRTEKVAR